MNLLQPLYKGVNMEIKPIDPKEIMNQEIERTRTKVVDMIMENITPDGSLSAGLVDAVLSKLYKLEGYLKCCADFGYFESREKINDFMYHFIEEILEFATINTSNVSTTRH